VRQVLADLLVNCHPGLSHEFRGKAGRWIASPDDGEPTSAKLRQILAVHHSIEVGYGSYGGCLNPRIVPSEPTFGRYCSLAPGIRIFRVNYPLNRSTTHPILSSPILGYVGTDKLARPHLESGNDAWMGERSIILPSVSKIDDSAVEGPGSVFCKGRRRILNRQGQSCDGFGANASSSLDRRCPKSRLMRYGHQGS
jgi:acetyltransferase-like isoleucine patch superfamily enzyme